MLRSCRWPKRPADADLRRGKRFARACRWPRLLAALARSLAPRSPRAPLRVNHADRGAGVAHGVAVADARVAHGSPCRRQAGDGISRQRQRAASARSRPPTCCSTRPTEAPLATLDGEELTARRTAGASAYAANKLARRDARRLVMVGADACAAASSTRHRHVRPIDQVTIWSRTLEHAERTAADCTRAGIPAHATRTSSAARRGRGHRFVRDVVDCAARPRPLAGAGHAPRPGRRVQAPHARDRRRSHCNARTLSSSDDRQAALAEGGDVVQAIASGAIGSRSIVAELRDFARGDASGRTRDDQITVFKSVGFALEDLAAAEAVLAADSRSAYCIAAVDLTRSRSRNFWILPVDVFGNFAEHDSLRHLESRQMLAAVRDEFGLASSPRRASVPRTRTASRPISHRAAQRRRPPARPGGDRARPRLRSS